VRSYRIGRKRVVRGAGYAVFLAKGASRVEGFEIAANRDSIGARDTSAQLKMRRRRGIPALPSELQRRGVARLCVLRFAGSRHTSHFRACG
jgi:hypothetical protein